MNLKRLAENIEALVADPVLSRRAAQLLRQPPPSAEAARLDGHTRLLRDHLRAVDSAFFSLDPAQRNTICDAAKAPFSSPEIGLILEGTADEMTRRLLRLCAPQIGAARELFVSLARLLEDASKLRQNARLSQPLGRGFAILLEARWRHRFEALRRYQRRPATAAKHRLLLLEDPVEGRQTIVRESGAAMDREIGEWLELERFAAMLNLARSPAATRDSDHRHIRWYLREDTQHGAVLERFGVAGTWLASGAPQPDLGRITTTVERLVGGNGDGWNLVHVASETPTVLLAAVASGLAGKVSAAFQVTGGGSQLPDGCGPELRRALRPRTRRVEPAALVGGAAEARHVLPQQPALPAYRLESDGAQLHLLAETEGGRTQKVLEVAEQPDAAQLLELLIRLDRAAATVAYPSDLSAARTSQVLPWLEALRRGGSEGHKAAHGTLALAGLSVRLVSIRAAQPHPLGGEPEVGLWFLADHLERSGARVDRLILDAADLETRLVELLGADVIGIEVFLHNLDRDTAPEQHVQVLIDALRRAGFLGRIVLGGPELRRIDAAQAEVQGFDALIRGEAEQVLPQVLSCLSWLDEGRWTEALELAAGLRGVVIQHGGELLLCDTQTCNWVAADQLACPLPFVWSCGRGEPLRLEINFTRGCPHQCTFCPSHQGLGSRAAPEEQWWSFAVFATADLLRLPQALEHEAARIIQQRLAVIAPPRLDVALNLLCRRMVDRSVFDDLVEALQPVLDPRLTGDSQRLGSVIGLELTLADQLAGSRSEQWLSPWRARQTWLVLKSTVLATKQLWEQEERHGELCAEMTRRTPRFDLATSEDNTVANASELRGFLERRLRHGLDRYFTFHPGQSSVADLLEPELVELLTRRNSFRIVLGADGTSNPVLRQNRKPRYRVADLLEVNRNLGRAGIEVENNYILLTPETDLLEAVESFLLFLLLPVRWRDHGKNINLRIIAEPATRTHNEGLIFLHNPLASPRCTDPYHEPLRCVEVAELLERWDLTPDEPSSRVRRTLRRILSDDPAARPLLAEVVRRWHCNFDDDPELEALARVIDAEAATGDDLAETLWRLEQQLQATLIKEGRTIATFTDAVRKGLLGTTTQG